MSHCKQSIQNDLDVSRLYRMPWTQSDNAFSWLEITRRCDLTCDYCYQTNDPQSDKTLVEIEAELSTLARLRQCDTIFISGGEPLVHPKLEDIVRLVKSRRLKPVLVTNGHRLTRAGIRRLKQAGLLGFIVHIDSGQSRPGWKGKRERQLNQLRQHYADMIFDEKGLICGFNTTILPETLHEVPDIVRWTISNIRKVCTNTLIPVRVPREDDPWEFYVQDRLITFDETVFARRKYKNPTHTLLTALDIHRQVLKVLPHFKGNAFLGGTRISDTPKWLFSNIIGTEKKVWGYMGPKAMEILQNGYHAIRNRFLSFLRPGLYARAKWLFPLGLFDVELRRAFFAFCAGAARNPTLLFKKTFVQSLLILQPQDVLPNGEQDLCDGCPNRTVHDGRLVPMCRKEEYLSFGRPVTLKKREARLRSPREPAVEKVAIG